MQLNRQDRGEDRLATYAFRRQRYKTDIVRRYAGVIGHCYHRGGCSFCFSCLHSEENVHFSAWLTLTVLACIAAVQCIYNGSYNQLNTLYLHDTR